MMITLKFVGKGFYKSVDHVTGKAISVKPGDVVSLSTEKGGQVLRDFPKAWERLDAPAAPTPAPSEPPAAPVQQPAAPPTAPVDVPAPAPVAPPAPKAAPKKKASGRR